MTMMAQTIRAVLLASAMAATQIFGVINTTQAACTNRTRR
jgi:hypothetical protein